MDRERDEKLERECVRVCAVERERARERGCLRDREEERGNCIDCIDNNISFFYVRCSLQKFSLKNQVSLCCLINAGNVRSIIAAIAISYQDILPRFGSQVGESSKKLVHNSIQS